MIQDVKRFHPETQSDSLGYRKFPRNFGIELELRHSVECIPANISEGSEGGASLVYVVFRAAAGKWHRFECRRVQIALVGLIGNVMECVRREVDGHAGNQVWAVVVHVDKRNVRSGCYINRRSALYVNQGRELPVAQDSVPYMVKTLDVTRGNE